MCIYCVPNHKINSIEWSNFYKQFSYPPVIMFGDFNSIHPLWGLDSTINVEGKFLEQFIAEYNLTIFNNYSRTRVPRPNWRDSIIDLTIASPSLGMFFDDWNVLSDPAGSDHFPILANLTNYTEHENNITIKHYNFKKADWTVYKKNVESLLANELQNVNDKNFDDRYNILEK